MEYTIPKGLFDILPQDPDPKHSWRNVHRWQYVESIMKNVLHNYGFQEIRTPIFEKTELFIRTVGDTSDIVSKEMYTFKDKADRSMTLRPEGTAPVMRSFAEKRLDRLGSLQKFYYIGPFFRYDRPQAGRFRQFHQLGVESIGNDLPEADVELIDMLHEIYRRLGIKDLKIMINSIGDQKTRSDYTQSLKEFLHPYRQDLTEESRMRLEKNPLRILDTKNEKEIEILQEAPSIIHFLTPESKTHFDRVQSLLASLGIGYEINPKLVRGLDYYNKTVFEITSNVLGAQNTIGAGGRFDGLLSLLGGPDLPASGFATGVERILQTMDGQNCFFPKKDSPFFYFLPLDEDSKKTLFPLLFALRHQGMPIEMQTKIRKIQKGLQQADRLNVHYCLIVGSEEIQTNQFKIKDMHSGETIPSTKEDLENVIKKLWSSHHV
ncbi:MAG: histidine--tRNA ligase [Simkaniaceae bacterium]